MCVGGCVWVGEYVGVYGGMYVCVCVWVVGGVCVRQVKIVYCLFINDLCD